MRDLDSPLAFRISVAAKSTVRKARAKIYVSFAICAHFLA
jgi:hypothetical protein